MADLEGIAHRLGARIEYVDRLHRGRWGEYRHDNHTIRLLASLGPIQHRCVLAHELGHAYHRHCGKKPWQERQADAYAVHLLIRPDEWRAAITVHDRVEAIVHDLQVTPRLVRAAASIYGHFSI